MFGFIGKLVKATIEVAETPVRVGADLLTGKPDEIPETVEEQAKKVAKAWEEAKEEL